MKKSHAWCFFQPRNRTVCEWLDVRSNSNIAKPSFSPHLLFFKYLKLSFFLFSFCVVCVSLLSLSHLFTSSKARSRSHLSFSPLFSRSPSLSWWRRKDLDVGPCCGLYVYTYIYRTHNTQHTCNRLYSILLFTWLANPDPIANRRQLLLWRKNVQY